MRTLESAQKIVNQFIHQHRADLGKIDFVVGVSRGGLIPAAMIATAIDKPLVCVYIDQQGRVYIDRAAWIKGKRVLLVDDIVRTGSTLEKMLSLLKRHKPTLIQSFTLYCLKGSLVKPTWTHLIARDRMMPWDREV